MNFRRIYKNKVALCNGKCILVAGDSSLAVKKIQKLKMLVPARTRQSSVGFIAGNLDREFVMRKNTTVYLKTLLACGVLLVAFLAVYLLAVGFSSKGFLANQNLLFL